MTILDTPPTHLRERVHGDGDAASFWAVGQCAAADIQRALGDVSRFRFVLDFGCGCGRVLSFMRGVVSDAQLYAVDIDTEAIHWLRDAEPNVLALATGDMPPLPYPDASFDLVYAVSVWTHLDEDRQRAWLAEMRRILMPGGLLVASLHGERAARRMMPPAVWRQIKAQGFAYTPVDIWHGVFPAWYGLAWHTPGYVARVWSDFLMIRSCLPGALNDNHDLVVGEKL